MWFQHHASHKSTARWQRFLLISLWKDLSYEGGHQTTRVHELSIVSDLCWCCVRPCSCLACHSATLGFVTLINASYPQKFLQHSRASFAPCYFVILISINALRAPSFSHMAGLNPNLVILASIIISIRSYACVLKASSSLQIEWPIWLASCRFSEERMIVTVSNDEA